MLSCRLAGIQAGDVWQEGRHKCDRNELSNSVIFACISSRSRNCTHNKYTANASSQGCKYLLRCCFVPHIDTHISRGMHAQDAAHKCSPQSNATRYALYAFVATVVRNHDGNMFSECTTHYQRTRGPILSGWGALCTLALHIRPVVHLQAIHPTISSPLPLSFSIATSIFFVNARVCARFKTHANKDTRSIHVQMNVCTYCKGYNIRVCESV